MATFWIATSWLATGLYFAPALSGKEPRGQKLGVNVLFIALLIVVAGSLAGQWMRVMQKLGLTENFWFGLWYARSAEFMQLPVIYTLKWMRVIGDTIIAAGSIVLVWFVFGLKYGWSLNKESD